MSSRTKASESQAAKKQKPGETRQRSRSHKYLAAQNTDWQMRKCLRCSVIFESWGPGNRRCPRCEEKLKSPSFRSAREEPAKLNI